jgi:hypothetical protein
MHTHRLLRYHSPRPLPPVLHLLAIHPRRRFRIIDPRPHLIPPLDIYILDVKGVNVSWEITQACKQDVDEKVGAAAGDKEDANGWDCGGVSRR